MGVVFSRAAIYDSETHVVVIKATFADHSSYNVRVSREALCDHFGGEDGNPPQLLRAFEANRALFEQRARDVYASGERRDVLMTTDQF